MGHFLVSWREGNLGEKVNTGIQSHRPGFGLYSEKSGVDLPFSETRKVF